MIGKELAMEQANFVLVMTPFQLEVVIGFAVLYAIGAGLVLKRIGYSTWWALFCLVPITALAGIWALAFVRWPRGQPRIDASLAPAQTRKREYNSAMVLTALSASVRSASSLVMP